MTYLTGFSYEPDYTLYALCLCDDGSFIHKIVEGFTA